jgi:dimeric dUTPase (all-alpha-NTP-PPase superfamily)
MADLQTLFDLQKNLQLLHGHDFDKMTIDEKETYTRDMILYLSEETHELLREINFKTYKKTKKPVNIQNVREEVADIQHFVINLACCWGMNAEDLIAAFVDKNKKNVQRVHDKNY